MQEPIKRLLEELKQGLIAIYGRRLKGLYLFGSYARGEEDAESDLDVLIVLDRVVRYGAELDRTSELTAKLSLDYRLSISRVFVSNRNWKNQASAFLTNAREEAIAA
jgi:predicted nucleotidyltransferase